MQKTNWLRYYESPFPAAYLTRQLVRGHLLRMLQRHGIRPGMSVAELGGGNSCFCRPVCNQFGIRDYTVFDNCEAGLTAFLKKNPAGKAVCADVLGTLPESQFDIVFSIGLAEHFSESETKKVIQAHFRMAKPDGLVILFVPTPTLLYRMTRRCAERLGLWHFPDERPIPPEELLNAASCEGTLLEKGIIFCNFLTQFKACFRKNSSLG